MDNRELTVHVTGVKFCANPSAEPTAQQKLASVSEISQETKHRGETQCPSRSAQLSGGWCVGNGRGQHPPRAAKLLVAVRAGVRLAATAVRGGGRQPRPYCDALHGRRSAHQHQPRRVCRALSLNVTLWLNFILCSGNPIYFCSGTVITFHGACFVCSSGSIPT